MAGVSNLEGVSSAADIIDGLFAGVDSGFIDDVVCLAVAFQWTLGFVGFVAIAGGFFIFLSGCLEYFIVVALDDVAHVVGAAVAQFYGVSV